MLTYFLQGLLLGLAYVVPIGIQNLYVINSALRENYFQAVSHIGAIPIAMPHEISLIPHYLNMIDGLVLTGGNFDVPPELYCNDAVHEKVTTKRNRTNFEMEIAKGALAANKPVLGICGGEQLLNVIFGGSLIQHIPDAIDTPLAHEQPNPRNEAGHKVKIDKNSLLYKIIGKEIIEVNSAHHQAVAQAGKDIIANSFAEDGVIEGIEHKSHRFCLGVQWHPEYHISEADKKIFQAFVAAAKA